MAYDELMFSDERLDKLEDRYLDGHLLDLQRYLEILNLASDPTGFAILDELDEAGDDGRTPEELADALDIDVKEVRNHIDDLAERHLVRRWRDSDPGEQGTHMHCEIGGYGLAALDAVETLLDAERLANDYFRSGDEDDDDSGGDDGDESPLTRYPPVDGPETSAVCLIESGCDPRTGDGEEDDMEDS